MIRSDLKTRLMTGELDETLARLYGRAQLPLAKERCVRVFDDLAATFGTQPQMLFSAPGRTEIGGNHTDHQHGLVLAGSADLDILAAVSANGSNVIRFLSEGYPMRTIDLSELDPKPEEKNTSAALIRGVAAWFAQHGTQLTGFDACAVSNVMKGSGLSSSAAFEVLLGTILNCLCAEGRYTPVQIAQCGQYAENIYFGKPSGLLDQMAASMGGIVSIDFADQAAPAVERVELDLARYGYALCIIDSGADHADLTDEYAAVPQELYTICAHFGKRVLREVPESDFYAALPVLRQKAGDRAVLRAIHVYDENRRVREQVTALRSGSFDAFLSLVGQSGLSSWRFLQNVIPAGSTRRQEVAVALALCETLLEGRGAARVHGGGFAGTVQAYVPLEQTDRFKAGIERMLGDGACHVLSIRSVGGVRIV